MRGKGLGKAGREEKDSRKRSACGIVQKDRSWTTEEKGRGDRNPRNRDEGGRTREGWEGKK